MTRYEKIMLLLLLVALGLQLGGTAYPSLVAFLGLAGLGLSYLVGGYWLFDSAPLRPVVKVVAGACLAAAMLSFFWTSSVFFTPLSRTLPVFNGLFCIGLGAYVITNRRRGANWAGLHGLWLRSAVWLAVSAFFAYCPISFTPYRKVLIALNQGREDITSNLLMFDYTQEYEAATARQDYQAALGYAQQALAMGQRWLGPPSELRELLAQDKELAKIDFGGEAWKISGVYTNVYEAYRKIGDVAYERQQYRPALQAYRAGDSVLVAGDYRKSEAGPPNPVWEEEKAWSLKNMAFCYEKLQQFEQSDSLFLRAMAAYERVYPVPDVQYARLGGFLAQSYADRNEPEASTALYRGLNRILARDTSRAARAELTGNRVQIAANYLRQDSVLQALRELEMLAFAPGDTSVNQQNTAVYRGISLYKLGRYAAADHVLRRPLQFYTARGERRWIGLSTTELLLARNSLARGKYAEAKALATAALQWRERKEGRTSLGYAMCLEVLAATNKAVGNYALAGRQLEQSIIILRQDTSAASTLSAALVSLMELEVTLGRVDEARAHSRQALAAVGEPIVNSSQAAVGVAAAYVDYAAGQYAVSEARYRQALAIHKRFGQAQTASSAAALHGLGLLALARHQLVSADTLFQQAIGLHERLFTAQHPLTGGVYLSCGLLRLQQRRYPEAGALIQRGLGAARASLPADHNAFGDIAMAAGELAQRQRQPAMARQQYEQALRIYSRKFGAEHWKTQLARHRLNQRG